MYRNTQYALIVLIIFSFFSSYFYHTTFALTLTDSESVSVSALVGSLPSIDTGGGAYIPPQSGVRFSGFAYPNALVTIQKGTEKVMTVTADTQGFFSAVIPENNNWQLFSLYAIDQNNQRSTLLNFPTVLYSGYLTDISGIRFAPTVMSDKLSVKKSDFLTFKGSSLPGKDMQLVFEGPEKTSFTLSADTNGMYTITVPISLGLGEYIVKIGYVGDTRVSKALKITVGTSNITRIEATSNIPGDCNFDQHVSIIDFSVLAYWFGKKDPPLCVDTNRDGIINLTDFSILAFYWSG